MPKTGNGSDIRTWSAVESCTGLFCTCAAPLKPLYRILCGRSPSTGARSSEFNYRYTRPVHAVYVVENHHDDGLNGKRSLAVSTVDGLRRDTESTTELVRPVPAAQNWPLVSMNVKVEEPV